MTYQLKLIDQNLAGVARELATGCWQVVDMLSARPPGKGLYRRLYRAVRHHLAEQAAAYRYCGAKGCDEGVPVMGGPEWHETFAPEPERLHRYLLKTERAPADVVNRLVAAVARVIVREYPTRRWPGLARLLRGRIERVLRGRLYATPRCGHTPLCDVNEPVDPWDAGDPLNAT